MGVRGQINNRRLRRNELINDTLHYIEKRKMKVVSHIFFNKEVKHEPFVFHKGSCTYEYQVEVHAKAYSLTFSIRMSL